eukprot:g652.t1
MASSVVMKDSASTWKALTLEWCADRKLVQKGNALACVIGNGKEDVSQTSSSHVDDSLPSTSFQQEGKLKPETDTKKTEFVPPIISKNVSPRRLTPPWRMFLLGDGSPTRHLQLLTGESLVVQVLEMRELDTIENTAFTPLIPSEVTMISAPYLQRQVWLKTQSGRICGYAASWWNAKVVRSHLEDVQIPIWKSL